MDLWRYSTLGAQCWQVGIDFLLIIFKKKQILVSKYRQKDEWRGGDWVCWNSCGIQLADKWVFPLLFAALIHCSFPIQVLESFLDSEFSSENLRFWCCIQDLKFSPNCQIESKAQYILEEFLAAGAPCQVKIKENKPQSLISKLIQVQFLQVNVDSRTLDETLRYLKESDMALKSQRFAFSLSEEHVFTLMSKDSYPR